jgi:hypothetical protein
LPLRSALSSRAVGVGPTLIHSPDRHGPPQCPSHRARHFARCKTPVSKLSFAKPRFQVLAFAKPRFQRMGFAKPRFQKRRSKPRFRARLGFCKSKPGIRNESCRFARRVRFFAEATSYISAKMVRTMAFAKPRFQKFDLQNPGFAPPARAERGRRGWNGGRVSRPGTRARPERSFYPGNR